MKRITKTIMTSSIVAISLCGMSMLSAQPCDTPGKGAHHRYSNHAGRRQHRGTGMLRGLVRRLELTEDQQQKVQGLTKGLETVTVRNRAMMAVKQAELKVLWLAETPDKSAIMAKHKEMQALRTAMMERHVDLKLAVHAILTPTQRLKFAQLRSHHGKHGQRKGMGRKRNLRQRFGNKRHRGNRYGNKRNRGQRFGMTGPNRTRRNQGRRHRDWTRGHDGHRWSLPNDGPREYVRKKFRRWRRNRPFKGEAERDFDQPAGNEADSDEAADSDDEATDDVDEED